MREGTAALLRACERIEVVGLACDGREAIELAARRRPDVVLLDLNMPEVGGIEACAALRERSPGSEVLIQFPLGRLSDRMDRRKVLVGIAIAAIVIAPLVMVVIELCTPQIFPFYLAITQAWVPTVIQIADVTGPLGVTFVLVAFNGGIYDAVTRWRRVGRGWWMSILAAGAVRTRLVVRR